MLHCKYGFAEILTYATLKFGSTFTLTEDIVQRAKVLEFKMH